MRLRRAHLRPQSRSNPVGIQLIPDNGESRVLVDHLRKICRMPADSPDSLARLRVMRRRGPFGGFVKLHSSKQPGEFTCVIGPAQGEQQIRRLSMLASTIALLTCSRDALLLHGAVATWNGHGVLFAGHSGAGKSTLCRRLPKPWEVLSDDASLVVRAPNGSFRVHPWPTWSRVQPDNIDETWDVAHSQKLAALVLLRQSATDALSAIGSGEAAVSITHSAEHLARGAPRLPGETLAHARRNRFAFACALASNVPCAILDCTLTGPCWTLVEKMLQQPGGVRGRP